MIDVHIKSIPNDKMRIPGGVGDYWYDSEGILQIRVVELGDSFMETMIFVHEAIEEALTKKRGLSEPEIQAFDEYYEMRRKQGLVPEDGEPGFDPNANYKNEHAFATGVELGMCALAGVSWKEYEDKINSI
jgi:hypothetical protein